MKRELGPKWTEKQEKEGKRSGKAWEEFFAKGEEQGGRGQQPDLASEAKAAEVQQRHEAELLRYPNVVGVAAGIRTRKGKPTGEPCLVVYVERKLPRKRLEAKDLLPSDIEGIPVDVVETGPLTPLSA